MSDEVLVRVERVSKKFCRSLKRSLWYGMKDIGAELLGRADSHSRLRKDEFWAVNDVSFELRRGECLGLIGHNGAGKTTLLKMLNGLIKPDKGRITMRGRVGALIALGAGFSPILSGRENIYVNGSVLGLSKRQIDAKVEEIIDFAEIRDFIDAPVQSYSSGMSVRLGFAVAAALEPDILLLDEVLAVGDIAFQSKCFNTLSRFRENGAAFILVSHSMHQISRYCDRVLYMSKGRQMLQGGVEETITLFTADMEGQARGDQIGMTDFSKVYGSGRVYFTGARFVDAAGAVVTQLSSFDAVTLCMDYHCPEPPVENVVLDVMIRDREGVLYQDTNLEHGGTFRFLIPRGTLRVKFENIPVNHGELRFFLAFLDAGSREVHDWKRHIPLLVKGKPQCCGRVLLRTEWLS